MAVIAYASSDPNPIANPGLDKIVDLSIHPANDLPVTVTLYADLVDDADGAPTKTFQWFLVGGDPDSTPVLVNDDTDELQITLNTWYNAQVFVVATNTNNGSSSPGVYTSATASAKVSIRLQEDDSGVERLALGEPVDERLNKWPEAIRDTHDALRDIVLADINDVTLPVADLNKLGDGSSMAGKHTHRGLDVPFATNTERGAVQFDAPSGTGKVAARERHQLNANFEVIPDPSLITPFATWYLEEDYRLVGASVVCRDGNMGTHSFAVVYNNMTPHTPLIGTGIALSGAPPIINGPLSLYDTPPGETILSAGNWVSMMFTATTGVKPEGVQVQIYLRRDPS